MTVVLAVLAGVPAAAGIVVAVALVALQAVVVEGSSMRPTLDPGQVVWATRWWPRRWLRPGVVIVIRGQGVRSADGSLRMIKRIAQLAPNEITVSADDPLGADSRTMGPIPYEAVAGIVFERGLFSVFRRSRRPVEKGE